MHPDQVADIADGHGQAGHMGVTATGPHAGPQLRSTECGHGHEAVASVLETAGADCGPDDEVLHPGGTFAADQE